MKTSVIAAVALLLASAGVKAQETSSTTTTPNGKIGNVSVETFRAANEKGNKMVAAVKPTDKPLSAADQKLMLQVAKGGKKQLQLSQAAVDKVQSPEAKLLAQSEVEEQTGVAAKLQEIATAKGIELPDSAGAQAQAALEQMNGLSGEGLDAYYVKTSGVKGHQKLQATMTKVLASAKDPALKSLATATMPVIKMHLNVSTAVSRKMGGSSAMNKTKAAETTRATR